MKGMSVDLAGRTALVTGGGGVLCSYMAKALAECGAKVVVADLRGVDLNVFPDQNPLVIDGISD